MGIARHMGKLCSYYISIFISISYTLIYPVLTPVYSLHQQKKFQYVTHRNME